MSDRSLLLGVVALQLDFIDRDQFVQALRRRAENKTQPITEILVELGGLNARQGQVLEALVDEHVMQHGGDVEKSLAAIQPLSAPLAEELRYTVLGDLDASSWNLESNWVSANSTPPPAPMTSAVGIPSYSGGRYRILRPHAKGGLGQVSVALDQELQREVVVKEILTRYADDQSSRSRFLREAEITGGLEHPSIVPVYGLGQYADGRPFYAMRFVRGGTLEEAIHDFYKMGGESDVQLPSAGAPALELRQLLRRFIDVCNAVEYAHSRGVLHRDIKPGNIILGRYGETLLVDWGLAKAAGRPSSSTTGEEPPLALSSGSDSAPTQLGTAIGTPGYMSPEQAAGRLDLMGPASDVYGLGGTLYTLITGRLAFSGSLADILQRIRQGDFPSPRSVRRAIPTALEAICLKAMALDPSQRYQSARSLANDLERWLADQPVLAWKEPAWQRCARWCRRHKTVVSTGATLSLAALFSLALFTIVLIGANRRIRTESQLAQRNFRQARRVVDDFYTTVSEETLLNKPGFQPLRMSLLRSALAYYRDFVAQDHADPSLRSDLAAANHRLALVTGEIESKETAAAAFRRAIAVRQQLCREHRGNLEYQRDLASSYHELGNLQITIGELATASDTFHKALRIRRQILAAETSKPRDKNELARTIAQIGYVQWHSDPHQALKTYEQATTVREQLVANNPSNAQFKHDLTKLLNNIALLQRETGSLEQSVATHERVLEIHASIAWDDLQPIKFQADVAKTLANLAELKRQLGETESSRDFYTRAMDAFAELAQQNPQVTEYQLNLTKLQNHVANVKKEEGQLPQALALYEQAREMLEPIVQSQPDILEARHQLAAVYNNLAGALLSDGQQELAMNYFSSGRAILTRIVQDDRNNLHAKRNLIVLLHELGRALQHIGEDLAAIETCREAIRHQNELHAKTPKAGQDLFMTRSLYMDLCGLQHKAGQYEQACKTALKGSQLCSDDTEAVYEFAVQLAISINSMHSATPHPAADNQRQIEQYSQAALQMLAQAVRDGLRNARRITSDSRLQILREHEDYPELRTLIEDTAPLSKL